MSTFLQLFQDAHRECGASGASPSAVTGQTGELLRIVEYVKQAWVEIQNRHDNWRWMRAPFSLETTADDDEYASTDATDDLTTAAIDRFASWRVNEYDNPPYIHLKSAGVATQTWLTFIDWNSFKWVYRRNVQNTGYPTHVSIDPRDQLVLGLKPNDVYVVLGTYQRSPQTLAADGDIPEMPSQYHQLIVYRAMQKYGLFEAAPEVLARGKEEGRRMMRQLEANQLPDIATAGPLA